MGAHPSFQNLPTHEAGCRMPNARTIEQGDSNYRVSAEIGSEGLLRALLRYGARHGLPNISANHCRAMLDGG